MELLMAINRRRAPSSSTSSEKKLGGHSREEAFADHINGLVIKGTQKADVKDQLGNHYSVKSGKKWQIFLYSYNRISTSNHLKILQHCLDCFTDDTESYFKDRIKCIAYKENYVQKYGKEKTKHLSNSIVEEELGLNEYISSKNKLREKTALVRDTLKDPATLRSFLDEAIFNCNEVSFWAIKDTTYNCDSIFKVFAREDVLDIFCNEIFIETSKAGKVPEDFNVDGQKTLLRYTKGGRSKNIGEIEVRNDSEIKYKLVRFNMYSKDVLELLLSKRNNLSSARLGLNVIAFGKAIQKMDL